MGKEMDSISEKTTSLWHRVNEKYGDHIYNLCVNGLGKVVLCKGYGEEIAKGNNAVQKALKNLLV